MDKIEHAYEKETHGHVWKKNDYDGGVDIFGFEIGRHNGPVCVVCGYGFCHHCQDVPSIDCPSEPGEGTKPDYDDDNVLPDGFDGLLKSLLIDKGGE